MIAINHPRPVVAGEDDECVFGDSCRFKCGENLSGGPIDFLDHIAILSLLRGTAVFWRGEERDMWLGVSKVEEEGLILFLVDKAHRALGDPGGHP